MIERSKPQSALTRRRCLTVGGAGVLALGLPARSAPAATATIRQGYQTNIWGMPTYYLLKSGYLDKHGIAVEEFAVPSGNLTMQQMVARQVDLGTYAGQSFIIGNAKGGLIAIALIEHVGKTARVTARKDLNITKVEELRGRRIANQTGSSVQCLCRYGHAAARFQQRRLRGSAHGRQQHGGRTRRQNGRCHGQRRTL